jgi:putative endopeptidase
MPRRLFLLLPFLLLLGTHAGAETPTASAKLWRGIDLAGMDRTKQPCEDFYQYANGEWLARFQLPPDRPRVYVFTLLADENRQKLRDILEAAAKDTQAAKNSIRGLVGTFYRSGMDEKRIEEAGARPLQPELDRIAALQKPEELLPLLAWLHSCQISGGFGFHATPDAKDSTRMIAAFSQGGLSLPDRDYYLKEDDKSKKIRAAYVEHIQKMLRLLGDAPNSTSRQAKTILELETRLAKVSRTRVALRDPHRNYNLMTVAAMEKETPGVSWQPYFHALGIDNLKEINVRQPEFLQELGQMIRKVPLDDWKVYLRWHLLDNCAAELSSPFVQEDFHFHGTVLQGIPRDRPRWERIVDATDHMLGEALGQLYVAREFPPEAKASAEKLVYNLKHTLRERLSRLEWMSPQTRKEAIKKLDAIRVKIGYPKRWRDYSGLVLNDDVYVKNVLAAKAFNRRYELSKIGKPVDRDEWHMTPPTVNAYYNPNLNEIVFPAGILQPPFFDAKADDAVNYGAIGMVIGHEMTHGFDDQGRKFDAAGNLRDWWRPDDAARYKERAAQVAKQYSRYVVVDGMTINGELTLGENIADLGGLKIAYVALQKVLQDHPQPLIDGFTPAQRFFLAYAQIWRGQTRPEAERMQLLTNPHSPARFRVLGPLYNMPEFFQAFGASSEQERGRLNPEPVRIW